MMDDATGELVGRRLDHQGDEAHAFYCGLPKPVRVGIEATGSEGRHAGPPLQGYEAGTYSKLRNRLRAGGVSILVGPVRLEVSLPPSPRLRRAGRISVLVGPIRLADSLRVSILVGC